MEILSQQIFILLDGVIYHFNHDVRNPRQLLINGTTIDQSHTGSGYYNLVGYKV